MENTNYQKPSFQCVSDIHEELIDFEPFTVANRSWAHYIYNVGKQREGYRDELTAVTLRPKE